MIFLDTSVLVAIVAKEEDQHDWIDRIGAAAGGVTSPLVVLEATMRLTTILSTEPGDVESAIMSLLSVFNIEIMPIEAEDTSLAIGAFAQYGKGRRHPARLNLADCLSYACAKRRGLKLLYKGGDFALTDLA